MDREASLRSAQRLLRMAAERLARLSDGVDDWDADEAQIRLAAARAWVDNTIAVGRWWLRRALDAAAIGLAVWVVAALCGQVIGLRSGWTITVAIVAAQVVA